MKRTEMRECIYSADFLRVESARKEPKIKEKGKQVGSEMPCQSNGALYFNQ